MDLCINKDVMTAIAGWLEFYDLESLRRTSKHIRSLVLSACRQVQDSKVNFGGSTLYSKFMICGKPHGPLESDTQKGWICDESMEVINKGNTAKRYNDYSVCFWTASDEVKYVSLNGTCSIVYHETGFKYQRHMTVLLETVGSWIETDGVSNLVIVDKELYTDPIAHVYIMPYGLVASFTTTFGTNSRQTEYTYLCFDDDESKQRIYTAHTGILNDNYTGDLEPLIRSLRNTR